jgi:hypothetical protein
VTETISGTIYLDGFFTNSSSTNTYHEIGKGTLTGATTGNYEMNWNFNCRNQWFNDPWPKHLSGMAFSEVWRDGKLFITMKYQYLSVFKDPWTDPIRYFDIWEPKCK